MFELDLTRVDYTWQPAGESQPNTFTAQNIFKSPSATVAGGVFQSSGTISAIPAGYGGSTIVAQFLAEESSAFPYTLYEATGNAQGHILALRASRGTYSARTATQSGDILGQLDFGGHNSSALVNGKASIRSVAQQNWSTTGNGTRLEFYVTTSGTTTASQIFMMEPGLVYSLTALQGLASVRASGSAGTVRDFRLTTNAVQRWSLIANATAETGTGNAGSDFEIRRYSDAGADLGLVMAVTRSTGDINFGGGGGYVYARNNLYVDSTCFINGASGVSKTISFRTALGKRWEFFCNNTAESSTATGSDFEFRRSDNSGVDLGLVMAVTRSTGNITFNGGGGTTTFSANQIRITTTQTPASATATGTAGTICWDANYIYVCTATDTWKRVAIATWP